MNKANLASSVDSTSKEIVFSVQPGGGPSLSVWATQPVVEIKNAAGQTISQGADASALITLSISNGSGQLIGETSVRAVAGIAVFVGLSIDISSNYKLKAVKADLSSDGGTAALTVESQSFEITAGPLYKIKLSGALEFDAGTCQPILIEAVDLADNPVTIQSSLSVVLTNNGRGSFYADETCTSSSRLSVARIDSGAHNSKIYFQDLGQESVRLYASSINLADFGSGDLDVKVKELKVTGHYVSVGGSHSCTAYGRIVFCKGGANANGELGYSTAEVPRALLLPANVSEIAVSIDGACALTVAGEVWCWGKQSQLGLNYASPTQITELGTTVKQIVTGSSWVANGTYLNGYLQYEPRNHFCALTVVASVNTVKCWGENSLKALGDGTVTARTGVVTASLPLDAGDFVVRLRSSYQNYKSSNTFAITNLGKVYYWGGNLNPTALSGALNVRDVHIIRTSGGYINTCLLYLNNTVGCYGDGNLYGQLGIGNYVLTNTTPQLVPTLTDVKAVSLGDYETYFIKGDGSLYRSGTSAYISPALTSSHGTVPSLILGSALPGVATPEKIEVPTILSFNDYHKVSAYVDRKFCAVSDILNDVVCVTSRQKTPTLEFVKIVPYQRLHFVSPVRLIERDTCQEFTVSIQNNDIERAASYDITLSAKDNEGTGRFYFDSNCTQQTTDFLFRKSNSRIKFYYKAANLGTKTKQSIISLTANDGVLGTASYVVQVSGRPFQLIFVNPRLVLLDQSGNPTFSDFEFSVVANIADPSQLSLYNEIGYTTPHSNNYTFPINVNGIDIYIKDSVRYCESSSITFESALLSVTSYQWNISADCGPGD